VTKLIVASRNFANAPRTIKNISGRKFVYSYIFPHEIISILLVRYLGEAKQSAHEGGKVSSLKHRPHFSAGETTGKNLH
jgi:hypothetical protein